MAATCPEERDVNESLDVRARVDSSADGLAVLPHIDDYERVTREVLAG
jgi:hypothetical protein